MEVATLPPCVLSPDVTSADLFDMEQSLRYSLNFMLNAEEINGNAREATRKLLQRLCKKLQTTNNLRKTLLQFVRDAEEAFNASTITPVHARAASAKIIIEMWAQRSNIFVPLFQAIFWSVRQVAQALPFPAFFEDECFIALAACPLIALSNLIWRRR